MATKISKNFTLEEFLESSTAKAKKIDNKPTDEERKHIVELVVRVLQPLRDAWGSGIEITSGFRCAKLNAAVGGSKTSAHTTGYAADTKPSNGNMKKYQKFVEEWLKKNGNFDQLIHEYPKKGVDSWVHIGYKNRAGKQRKMIFSIV